ncbi:class I SAM-dependent methyltransferase [Streptomyces sp. SDT5-1]|uniref:class I SAM-dependent methyltransferase n=1 Tax=Streptomyces sp. SDT5-1 TaxID=3406418 RepID=UPI003FCFF8FA
MGCGTGELATHLHGMGYQVDAVDWAPAALARAEAQHGASARWLALDIEHDDLAELRDGYDLITLRLVYPFLHDRAGTLRTLAALLRPGGALVVIAPLAEHTPAERREIALDEEELAQLQDGWASVQRHDAARLTFVVLKEGHATTADTPAHSGDAVARARPRGGGHPSSASAGTRNERAWTLYGKRQMEHGYMPPVPDTISWGPWSGVGPGSEILGDLTAKRVLDIGSGPGHHAVHLARDHGAHVTAIEQAATQHARATAHFGNEPGIRWLHGDILEHLCTAMPYDAAYAIGSLAYINPHELLPALRDGLNPHAPLVFSVLHTDLHGHGPDTRVAPREQEVRLRNDPPLTVDMWVLAPRLWRTLLAEHHFQVEAVDVLRSPDAASPVVHQVIRARRLPHVRDSDPPS